MQMRWIIKHQGKIVYAILFLLTLTASLLITILIRNGDINWVVISLLKILFVTVAAGLIVSVASNFTYDWIKKYVENKNFKAFAKTGLIHYFNINDENEKERRAKETLNHIKEMRGKVCLLAVAGTSFFRVNTEGYGYSDVFKDKIHKGEIDVDILLLNPYSESAKIRIARELNYDVGMLDNYHFNVETIGLTLIKDIKKTMTIIKQMKEAGCKGKINLRLTNYDPIISIMYSSKFAFVDILSLGKKAENDFYDKLGSMFPVAEYDITSSYYQIVKSHFDYYWRFSISAPELVRYRAESKRRYWNLKNWGYQLITQHESWLSIDPIVGCKNNCRYCLHKSINEDFNTPKMHYKIRSVVNAITNDAVYKGNPNIVLGIFNSTDAFLKENRSYLIGLLREMSKNNVQNKLCISTKTPLPRRYVQDIVRTTHRDKLIVFFSLSGLNSKYEPNFNETALLKTMDEFKKKGVKIIHYWRPIIENVNDSDVLVNTMITKVNNYTNTSVVTGLKAGDTLNQFYRDNGMTPREKVRKGDYLSTDTFSRIKMCASQNNHNIYRHTSCAISCLFNTVDYNSSYFDKKCEDISNCSEEQKNRCAANKKIIDEKMITDISEQMNISIDCLRQHEKYIEILDIIGQQELITLRQLYKVPFYSKKMVRTSIFQGSILSNMA